MSNNRNSRPKPLPPQSASLSPDEFQTVSFTLRLPDKLKETADSCSFSLGTSLNGLICTALGDYLAQRGYKVYF